MPLLEWNSSFELGIRQIDDHHKQLVSLINDTYDHLICDASYETIGAVLVELVDYASYHFAAEEQLMKERNYPHLPQHKGEHERFSSRVAQIQNDFLVEKSGLRLDVLVFLKNWLSHHILNADAEFGRFAAGLSQA